MGCASGSDETRYACLVVRCDDGFSVAVYIETSRPMGDAGRWTVQIDDVGTEYTALALADSPYGARIVEPGDLVERLKNGGVVILDPLDGPPPSVNGISLSGSLYVINQALYFCAPKVAPEGAIVPDLVAPVPATRPLSR